MQHHYFLSARHRTSWLWAAALLTTSAAQAQAPAWDGLLPGISRTFNNGVNDSQLRGVTTDAQGNVYVVGFFQSNLTLGSTTLTSLGVNDLFVAKYVPRTSTWAWAQQVGGTANDLGTGIAVSGSSVYVTGIIRNNVANVHGVLASGSNGSGQSVSGATATVSDDVVLVKYTDVGTTATLAWTQVGGGTSDDLARAVAVSGSSVYVGGYLVNDQANSQAVVLGGTGTTPGTVPQYGTSALANADLLLAKYTDNGSTATLGWTQIAGGAGADQAYGVAASGTRVFVAGAITNDLANSKGVLFGGSGTVAGTQPQYGASNEANSDLLLACYTDNGPTASFNWSQVGGARKGDYGQGVAVSGNNVYVVGALTAPNLTTEPAALFGGSGTTPGTSPQLGPSSSFLEDLVLAKYTDNGPTATFGWSQVGGGALYDVATGVAVSGSSVYVTGGIVNDPSNGQNVVFGGSGTTLGTVAVPGVNTTGGSTYDLLLARYTDNGSTGTYNWARVGGGNSQDLGLGVAVSGQQVFTAGLATPVATFGPSTLAANQNYNGPIAAVVRLTDPTLQPLATQAGGAAPALILYPNPAPGAALLTGATPGAVVRVLDMLGRIVATSAADATGTARLAGLAPGLYLVQAGSSNVRLAAE